MTSLLILTLLLSQSTLQEERVVTAASPAQVSRSLSANPERSNDVTDQWVEIAPDSITRIGPNCTPITNVAFVKTHKAAGSTVANILQRFGYTRNLQFALPNTKSHDYAYNYISRAGEVLTPSKLIPLRNGSRKGYNILCNHSIYNRTAFHLFMPQNTRYISILREPFSQFVSTWEYYRAAKIFTNFHHDFILGSGENPLSFYLRNPHTIPKMDKPFSYLRNKLSEDLGLGMNEYFFPFKLKEYLETLRRDFTLVMLMEFFDESLLLLKRKLCWELKDILYIPQNVNQGRLRPNYSSVEHKLHKSLSHLDYTLYAYFRTAFKEELQNQSQEFYEELAHFKDLLKKVHKNCTSAKSFHTAETKWHNAFELSTDDCRLMLMPELPFFDLLVQRARNFY